MVLRIAAICLICVLCVRAAAAQPGPSCPADFAGYLPPRLAVGLVAEIDPAGTPNRLRETPAPDGAYLGDIAPGSRIPVLEGPACADGIVWWRVEHQGALGWTAESNVADRMYYLRLAPADAQPQPTATPDGFPLHAAARAVISLGNLEVLAALPFPALPAVRMAAAQDANILVLASADGVLEVYNAGQPAAPLARTALPGPVYALTVDATGTQIAVGWLDVGGGGFRAQLWRFDVLNAEPLMPAGPPIDLSAALPLSGIVARPPLIVTLHGTSGAAQAQNRGLVMVWDTRSGAASGRLDLGFMPTQAVFDPSGALLAISAGAMDGQVETHIIDMRTLEIAHRLPAHGALAFRLAEGDGRARLFVGQPDGRLTFVDFDMATSPSEQGGGDEVAVFQPTGNLPIAVGALAVSPDQALLAAGGGLPPDAALPDGYVTTVRFLEAASGRGQAARLALPDARAILALAFSADGTALLVQYFDALGAPLVRAFGVVG